MCAVSQRIKQLRFAFERKEEQVHHTEGALITGGSEARSPSRVTQDRHLATFHRAEEKFLSCGLEPEVPDKRGRYPALGG